MSQASNEVSLRRLVAPFAKPIPTRAVGQLLNTLIPFAALWALMAWSVVAKWGYGWTLLMAIPTAGSTTRSGRSSE